MASNVIAKSKNWNDKFRVYVNDEGLKILIGVLSFDKEVYGLIDKEYAKKLKDKSAYCFYVKSKTSLPFGHRLSIEVSKMYELPYKGEEIVMSASQMASYSKEKKKLYKWFNDNSDLMDKVAKKAFASMPSPSKELKSELVKFSKV